MVKKTKTSPCKNILGAAKHVMLIISQLRPLAGDSRLH